MHVDNQSHMCVYIVISNNKNHYSNDNERDYSNNNDNNNTDNDNSNDNDINNNNVMIVYIYIHITPVRTIHTAHITSFLFLVSLVVFGFLCLGSSLGNDCFSTTT